MTQLTYMPDYAVIYIHLLVTAYITDALLFLDVSFRKLLPLVVIEIRNAVSEQEQERVRGPTTRVGTERSPGICGSSALGSSLSRRFTIQRPALCPLLGPPGLSARFVIGLWRSQSIPNKGGSGSVP